MLKTAAKYQKYPEYQDSGVEWLGEIPKTWGISRLKYTAEIFGRIGFRGYTVDDIVDEGEGALVLSPSNIIGDQFSLDKKTYLSWKKYYESPEIMVELNDILLVKTGSTYGKSAIIPEKREPMTINPQMALLKKMKLEPRFLYYLFQSTLYKALIDVSNTGSGMPTMTQENINSFPILYPNVQEVLNIANFLDHGTVKIDSLIAKQEKLIELLKEKRQAVISHAVTKGLNPDVAMKDSGVEWLGEVPEHWGVIRLKHLILDNLVYGANEAAEDDNPNNPRYIRITDMNNDGSLDPNTFRSLPYHIAQNYFLEDGDILLARSGATVGKSFLFKDEFGVSCFAGYLIRARANKKKLIPKFASWFFQSEPYWKYIAGSQIQATIQNVSAEKYGDLYLSVSDIQDQVQIANFLDHETAKIDSLITKANSAIQLMQERRTALISAAVTGKIDVRDWQAPQQQSECATELIA